MSIKLLLGGHQLRMSFRLREYRWPNHRSKRRRLLTTKYSMVQMLLLKFRKQRPIHHNWRMWTNGMCPLLSRQKLWRLGQVRSLLHLETVNNGNLRQTTLQIRISRVTKIAKRLEALVILSAWAIQAVIVAIWWHCRPRMRWIRALFSRHAHLQRQSLDLESNRKRSSV